ncbi:MAG: LppA family lipoprotein [Pseudonocardiaceae bacterium]
MQAELRDRLSADIGGLAWVNDGSENRGGCGFEFPDVPEGETRSLARWVALGNLPDARWNDALAIVQEITEKYGFGTPEVIVNRPVDHRVVVPDPYGGTLDFGTAVNTVLSMHTGCHLPSK